MKRKKAYIILFVVYMATVIFLCLCRPKSIPDISTETLLGIPLDKIAHSLMFFPFPFLSSMSFMQDDGTTGRNLQILVILAIVGSGLAYGTEVLQGSIGYRSYEIKDYISDLGGIVAGTLFTAGYIIHKNHLK